MNGKTNDFFTPHALMHDLLGLGVGILIVALIPSLTNFWLGVVVIVVALVLDIARKK